MNLWDKLDSWIEKHHKCKKYTKLFSITYHEVDGIRYVTDIEYRCEMCDKRIFPPFDL